MANRQWRSLGIRSRRTATLHIADDGFSALVHDHTLELRSA
jgi:hypothetical protein